MKESLHADVAVLGTGISGYAVAEALHAAGRNVVMLSPPHSPQGVASSLSSGIWDLGPVSLAAWKDKVPFRELARSPAFLQPLASLLHNDAGLADVEKGIGTSGSSESRVFASLYWGAEDRPALLPTEGGHFRAAYAAQKLIYNGDATLWPRKRVGVVVCPQWRLGTESLIGPWTDQARQLGIAAELLPFKIVLKGFDWPLTQLAARLAADAEVARLFAEQVKAALKNTPADLLLFPPLFLNPELAVAWEKEWQVTVAEFASAAEPIAGKRLGEAMKLGRQAMAVEWLPVQSVRQPSLRQNTFLVTTVTGDMIELKAKAVALCTGKFLGGGLEAKDRFRETVLDLPLFVSRAQPQISYPDELSTAADRYRLGLWLDEWHRPRSRDGLLAENLFASGSIVGGVDFAAHRFGTGFFSWLGRQCGKKISSWLG